MFFRFETVNVLKYQHHVCFNDEPKPCLSVSIDDRQSIKTHHPKGSTYTVFPLVQLLLLFHVVKCSPAYHLSHFFNF